VTGHGVEIGAGAEFEALSGSGADGTGGAFLIGGRDADGRKCEVRVTIDEAGHDDTSGGVNFDGVAGGGEVLDAPGGPDLKNDAVADQHGAISNDAKIVEARSEPWPRWTPQGQKTAGTAN